MRYVVVWTGLAMLALSGLARGDENAWSALDYDLYPGDFNGDGLDDLLYVAKRPDKPSGIALSDGKSPTISQQSCDFNGDGRDDVLCSARRPATTT